MSPELKKVPARFFRSSSGREPVREWLKTLDKEDRRAIGQDIATLEYGWPVGMPVCRPLGAGLWEVRSRLPSRRIARGLFMIAGGNLVLLHGFIKKTQGTPQAELAIARGRMREVMRHESE